MIITKHILCMNRSAFSMFYFGPTFFSGIEKGSDGTEERCKVMVRSLLLAFRSLSCLEKTVASCTLELNSSESKLLLCFHCRLTEYMMGFLRFENMYGLHVFLQAQCPQKLLIRHAGLR